MKAPPRPLPGWLEWVCWIGGGLFLAGHVVGLLFSVPMAWAGTQFLRKETPKDTAALLFMMLIGYGPLLGNLIGFWIGYVVVRLPGKRRRRAEAPLEPTEQPAPRTDPVKAAARASRKTRWSLCNVLETEKDVRHLWQFSARSFQLQREEEKLPNEPLSAKMVAKDWNTLFQPKLNVAWLPADKVFLRVVQLPPAENLAETLSMLEFQLEKLSPLPVAQVVWTFELLRRPGSAATQTAIVVIAPRNLVEEHLGKLETEGYLADRLEVPFIDQLLATKIQSDGVWIYPGAGADENNCLVAWWCGGVLHSVSLLHVPAAEERGAFLREQIAQMAWAGELEGWITSLPRRFLVADAEAAAVWQPLLQEGLEQRVEVVAPLPDAEVAKLTARRAARENAAVSLVPPEFTTRYRQRFVDRIWMRAVFGVAITYLFGVLIYLAWVQYLDAKVSGIEQSARNLSPAYTNALRLKEQVQVMQDQLNLQWAGLECYKAVAKELPDGLQLDGMNFQKGKTLAVYGTAPAEAFQKVSEFSDTLRRVTVNGQPLFKPNSQPPQMNTRGAGGQISWSYSLDLAKGESD